jgi:HEAT repeat protein
MFSRVTFALRTPALVLVFAALAMPAFGDGPSLETLLAYLKSPNVSTRRDAAHKLGERRVRNQHAVESLAVAAARDEDASVRAEAVRSLGMIKDFSALKEMLEALRDPEPVVRRAAVKSLVTLYTEHDVDFITNRHTGWNLLNPFLDTSDHEILEPYVVVDPGIVIALGESARGDHDRDVRIAAIRALGVLRGREAIPYLADALTADREVRIDVIRTFIKIGDPAAGQHLISFFRETDQRIRTQAMFAAGYLRYKPAQEPLLAIYALGPEKKSSITKVAMRVKGRFGYMPPRDEAALWALSLIGDEKSERIFVQNMTSKDGDRRQYAFEGLARIGDPRYQDQISRLLVSESNGDVKLAQYWALYRMGGAGQLQNIVRKLDGDQSEQAAGYLLETANLQDLYPYVHSNNKAVRLKLIEILGRIGDQETVAELEPMVRTSGAGTADAATVAIKRIEWRMSGRPRASDNVMHREPAGTERPRRAMNQR